MRLALASAALLLSAACASTPNYTAQSVEPPSERQTARERFRGPCEPPACRVADSRIDRARQRTPETPGQR